MCRLNTIVCAFALALVLAGCGGGGSQDATALNSTVVQTVTSADGGIVAVDAVGSPLLGLQISFPAAALGGDSESITVQYRPDLPGEMQAALRELNAEPIGPTVVLSRSGIGAFGEAVMLKLPARATALQAMDVLAMVWDPDLSRYVPLEVVSIDAEGGYVYVMTRHFSWFVVFGVPRMGPASINTGFDPAVHGFEHPNITTVYDNGDCYGITAFSRWHFQNRKSGPGLYTRFGGGDRNFFGDGVVREIMAEAQDKTLTPNKRIYAALFDAPAFESASRDFLRRYFPIAPGADLARRDMEIFHGRRLAALLRADGPQLLMIGSDKWRGNVAAHAVLVYAYEAEVLGDGGTFVAYDPNYPYPAAPLRIKWSPATGFSLTYPDSTVIGRFWVTAADTWASPQTMAAIESTAVEGSLKNFAAFDITNLKLASGAAACITTDAAATHCNLVTSVVGNQILGTAGVPIADRISIWNRSSDALLVDRTELTLGGAEAQYVPIALAELAAETATSAEIIVHEDSGASAENLEANGNYLTRYRAFSKVQVKPVRLALQGRNVPTGYEFSATLDGAPITVSTTRFAWRKNGQIVSGATESLLVVPTGSAPVGTSFTFSIQEGPDAQRNAHVTMALPGAEINLGSAAAFGAFGGSAGLTNNGTNTVVNARIGTTAASTALTGFHDSGDGCTYTETSLSMGFVTGNIYTAGPPPTLGCPGGGTTATLAVATLARADALAAYDEIVAKPSGPDPGSGNLANLSLAPGVYTAASGSFKIEGGNLILDAQGDPTAVWVFQMATSLTVGGPGPTSPSSVILTNGALAKNVFWQVGTFATINTAGGGTVVGTIIAQGGASISSIGNVTLVTINGRVLSLNSSVTMVNTVINLP